MVNGTPTLAGYLAAHLNRLNEGDYFALLEMNEAHERVLQEIRQEIRDVRRACLEFGPRFLHSTGAYKGGPNTATDHVR
jgi:transaldolase/glucose-6-phosphate isomerase